MKYKLYLLLASALSFVTANAMQKNIYHNFDAAAKAYNQNQQNDKLIALLGAYQALPNYYKSSADRDLKRYPNIAATIVDLVVNIEKVCQQDNQNINIEPTPAPATQTSPIQQEEADVCPICQVVELDSLEAIVRVLACGHRYCADCINHWEQKCKEDCKPFTCPTCRHQ